MVSNRFPRDVAGMVVRLALIALVGACASDGPGVLDPSAARTVHDRTPRQKGGKRPAPAPIPAFIFTSNDGMGDQLYRWRADTITQLTFTEQSNARAHVAAGRIVFTSYRDGDAEIYFGDTTLTSVRRLTQSPGLDDEAAVDPSGSRIVYVSAHTGTLRMRIADTLGSWTELVTGAGATVPERAPAWDPAGSRIAFSSNRDGSSQIYIVSAQGGSATRLTFESVGAFNPEWTADGTAVVYVASAGGARLRRVDVATGTVTDLPDMSTLGEPACGTTGCLATQNPSTSSGDIVWMPSAGATVTVVNGTGNDSHPAILQP